MRSDIIEKVRKAVSKTAKKAAKVSGDTIDYTKLKLKLYDIRDSLDENYAKIGRLVYDGEDSEEIEKTCTVITELRDEEAQIKEKIDALKNRKTCEVCGERVESDSEYCRSCGHKF